MKKMYFFFVLMMCSHILLAQDFITRWKFSGSGTSINFKALTAGGAVNYTWTSTSNPAGGSGSFTQTVAGPVSLPVAIVAGDEVQLSIAPANLRRFYNDLVNSYNTDLIDVAQWGGVPWSKMDSAFFGCINLDVSATDVPNLSAVTSAKSMFNYCTNLVGNSSFNNWNTSSVADMSNMFMFATIFDQAISGWNTGNVTNMSGMFAQARQFNQPVGSWNTAKVTNMSGMFSSALVFNQPLSGWNTGNVTNMSAMFSNAEKFNQPVGNWNTAKVTTMASMFMGAKVFDQDISDWNTANVTTMASMFRGAWAFNQNIESWNTGKVTTMSAMFQTTNKFNQPLAGWNTANVTTMADMFGSSPFNQPIGNWNTAKVTNMSGMFFYTPFNQDIGNWDVGKVVNMSFMFTYAPFNQDLSGWNTISVTNMRGMLSATPFNQPINTWNTANVTTMEDMFSGAQFFNQPLGNWNTAKVQNMLSTFAGAAAFNQDISGWNVSKVTNLSLMFYKATAFNQSLGTWILNPNAGMSQMLDQSGLDCTNYGLTLKGWAENNPTVTNRVLGSQGLVYGPSSVSYRDQLLARGWTISGDTYSTSCAAVLPVDFGDIKAVVKSGQLTVSWTTLSETNNDHFEIEASTDGVKFVSIGEAHSQANSGQERHYSFSRNLSSFAGIFSLTLLGCVISFTGKRQRGFRIAGGTIFIILLVGLVACNKYDTAIGGETNSDLYIRIKQVDVNGDYKYSKMIKAIKE